MIINKSNGQFCHSADTIDLARSLWDQGLSASDIGRKLGVTKNVVIGIARRNHFRPRESPLKELDVARMRRVVDAYNRHPRFAHEIAAKLDVSPHVVRTDIARARKEGWDVVPQPEDLLKQRIMRGVETKRAKRNKTTEEQKDRAGDTQQSGVPLA